ncbi:MAG: hypothetical protein LLG02_09480 [Pelosinus sp.]|nr:hypothetical protein [Pelosinus sp.]
MANTVKKKHPDDMTRKELISRLEWPERTFTERFNKFLKYYGISKKHFTYDVFESPQERLERMSSQDLTDEQKKQDENRKILIDYRYKDLLFVLMKAYEKHPLYRENYDESSITLERVIAYNEKLIDLVDTLPEGMKYNTMAHPAYYRTVNQLPTMKKLSEKIHQFLAASVLVPKQVRLQVWEEMFDFVDYMIFRTFDLSVKYHQEQKEVGKREKNKAKKRNNLLKTDPNQAYHEMLAQLFDDRNQDAKQDGDLPCDTLDGYLVMLLKTYIIVVEELDAAPKLRVELEKDVRLSNELAKCAYNEIGKKIGASASEVQAAEQEIWKQEVIEYAEQAKKPFDSVIELRENMKDVWDKFKDHADCDLGHKHYKEFLDFCDQVEKAVNKGDYLITNIVKDPALDIVKKK